MARERVVCSYIGLVSSRIVAAEATAARQLFSTCPRPYTRRRVVVTGIGVVSPLACSTGRTWQQICDGKTGVRVSVSEFDGTTCISFCAHVSGRMQAIDSTLSAFAINAVANVPKGSDEFDFSASSVVDKLSSRTGSPDYIAYALHAARQALIDAQLLGAQHASTPCGSPDGPLARVLLSSPYNTWRMGVAVGSGIGGIEEIGTTAASVYGAGQGLALSEAGIRRTSPFFVPRILANMAAGGVALAFGLHGPNLAPSTACASGAHSLGEAARAIALGTADVMLAGGTEACIGPLALAGFSRAKALAAGDPACPWEASRPFDTGRAGFVLGEGAAILCLEEAEAAEARGARIYAELRGFGASCDAWHVTSPPPDGSGALAAMLAALHDAGVGASEVGYINAHATGTPTGDAVEATAIGRLLGSTVTAARLASAGTHAASVGGMQWEAPSAPLTTPATCMVSSTKGAVGHLLGAAGAIEAAFTVLALHTGRVPATVNLTAPDPALPLDVASFPSQAGGGGSTPHPGGGGSTPHPSLRYAMSNSFGFGGTNSSLVFGRWEGKGR